MNCFERFLNRTTARQKGALALCLGSVLLSLSCSQLSPSYKVTHVEGRIRAAAIIFDNGWIMPEDCEIHGVCGSVLFGRPDWKEVVVTLECRCEKEGVSRYGQLVRNAYLVDRDTFAVRPGGEDLRKEEYQLPRGGGASDLLRYAKRDADGLVARGTHIRFQGKYGQYPGLTQSDSGNRLAALSYDAFGRETYGLFPDPSHLIGYAHKGTFYISVHDVGIRQELGSMTLKYQGLPPDSFGMDFYGENLLFTFPYDRRHGIVISLPQ